MDGSLRAAYREQFEMYPSLSQEEVEEIYAREGIKDKSIAEVIKELEDEIRVLKSEQDSSIREDQETLYENYEKRSREIATRVAILEEKRMELKRIQSELEELMSGIESSSRALSSINKVRTAEERLLKIKMDYASVFKQLYSSSRGIIRRKRKFPSSELRNEIVLGHLSLARGLASKYYKMCDKKVEFDDLHQIAYEALMSAAHYYIPGPRAKFKTYAARCIENKLRRTIGEVKKRQKKRTAKPLEFIDEELRRVDYVMMLIDACRNVRGKDENKYFSNRFDLNPTGVQYKFKRSIRLYNSGLRKLGLTREQLPSFKVKRSEVGFQEVLSVALSYLKESKMKVLINSLDLEMASLVASYENHAHDLHEIYELLYTIELYQKRLRDVRLLLEVEIALSSSSDGIVPSKEELLIEVNRRIAAENKGIYKAKHNPTRVSYKSLYSYYGMYYDLWGVDFLAQEEFGENRAKEIRNLEDDFEYRQNETVSFYRSLIDDISDSSEEVVCLYRHRDGDDRYSSFLETWDDNSWEPLAERVFTKEQAIEFVKGLIQELEGLTRESYVNRTLEWRKQVTLDELNRLNAEVIEKNRAMEDTVRQQRATHYVRYWTMENVQNASEWLNVLYESGLSIAKTSHDRSLKPSQSVEDEAIGNLFMEDYISALDSLPPLEREILNLYYDENGTHSTSAREIAEILGLTEKEVYRKKDKALRLLRKSEVVKAYLE